MHNTQLKSSPLVYEIADFLEKELSGKINPERLTKKDTEQLACAILDEIERIWDGDLHGPE